MVLSALVSVERGAAMQGCGSGGEWQGAKWGEDKTLWHRFKNTDSRVRKTLSLNSASTFVILGRPRLQPNISMYPEVN